MGGGRGDDEISVLFSSTFYQELCLAFLKLFLGF